MADDTIPQHESGAITTRDLMTISKDIGNLSARVLTLETRMSEMQHTVSSLDEAARRQQEIVAARLSSVEDAIKRSGEAVDRLGKQLLDLNPLLQWVDKNRVEAELHDGMTARERQRWIAALQTTSPLIMIGVFALTDHAIVLPVGVHIIAIVGALLIVAMFGWLLFKDR